MSTDKWVVVKDDKTIWLRQENDGPGYLRKGPEVTYRQTSLAELKERHPKLYEMALIEMSEKGFHQ